MKVSAATAEHCGRKIGWYCWAWRYKDGKPVYGVFRQAGDVIRMAWGMARNGSYSD